MNFLCHLYLSGDDPELMLGNFMGDFVKGRIDSGLPLRVQQGIMLHRRIDSFAQRNERFQASRRRLDPVYGLYRGVMVDLFYDYFLAQNWAEFGKGTLQDYLDRVRMVVDDNFPLLPPRLQEGVPFLFAELLPSYGTTNGIGQALSRMSRRISRPNPLPGGEQELVRHHAALQSDFRAFMSEALEYVATLPGNQALSVLP